MLSTLRDDTFKSKFKLILGSLLDAKSALPIFVSATITRAVVALIDVICVGQSISFQVMIALLYSFFIHPIGFIIANCISNTNSLFDYYFAVATDLVGFSWKYSLCLILFKWIQKLDKSAIIILIWFVLMLMIIVLISASNNLQIYFGRNNTSVISVYTSCYEGEVFSLSLAFSFNLMIAALIYKEKLYRYLVSDTDDDIANEDDDDSLRQWYYLLYVLFITIGILVINSYVKLSENCCFKESINTLIKLYHTTLAYTIGCSWYILGYLCFQSIFFHLDKGYLLGLFLYSIIMTLVFVFANTIIALKNNAAEYCEPGTEHKNLASPKLLMVSGRLVIGWLWSDFITGCVSSIIPQRGNKRNDLELLMKFVIALVIFFIGTRIELRNKTINSIQLLSSKTQTDKRINSTSSLKFGAKGLKEPLIENVLVDDLRESSGHVL
jgi:hypothetical protein